MDQKKLTDAMHRIEELWNETEGKCYVSFSGGKDSTVLLALIKMCQDLYTIGEIPAVFSNTGIELGVTVDFVRWVKENYYPNVQIIRPLKSFDQVIKEFGKPLKSKMKDKDLSQYHYRSRTEKILLLLLTGQTGTGRLYAKHRLGDADIHMLHDDFPVKMSNSCCDWMKKKPFEHYAKETGMKGVMLGLRASEGGARESAMATRVRFGGKPCTWMKGKIIQKAPIIDWTDEDVEKFITEYHVPLSDAYTVHHFDRTGCMACPYAKNIDHDLEYLFYHEPSRYKAAMHWMKDVYIAKDVHLPFDEAYEREREQMWQETYRPMRIEMLEKYRPNSRLLKKEKELYGAEQSSLD